MVRSKRSIPDASTQLVTDVIFLRALAVHLSTLRKLLAVREWVRLQNVLDSEREGLGQHPSATEVHALVSHLRAYLSRTRAAALTASIYAQSQGGREIALSARKRLRISDPESNRGRYVRVDDMGPMRLPRIGHLTGAVSTLAARFPGSSGASGAVPGMGVGGSRVIDDQRGDSEPVIFGPLDMPAEGRGRMSEPRAESPSSVDGQRQAGEERTITIKAYGRKNLPVITFAVRTPYRLSFQVGIPGPGNLALGDTKIEDVPPGGLHTHWILSAPRLALIEESETVNARQEGGVWIAEFSLLIPEHGESENRTINIATGDALAPIDIAIYAVLPSGKRHELYRRLTVNLDRHLTREHDATLTAAAHTHLRTTHEWTTPSERVLLVVMNDGRVQVITSHGNVERIFQDDWVTDNQVAGRIQNVRKSLDQFRDKWGTYLDDLDAADMRVRLANLGGWQAHSEHVDGWEPLPDASTAAHQKRFDEIRNSREWRALAVDGYALYNSFFPPDGKLRRLVEALRPSSRLNVIWTRQRGGGWVSHVPWALMHMDPVDSDAALPDPLRFFGLRFRLESRTRNGESSRALGDRTGVYSLRLLYWGDQAGDDVANESRWQAQEYSTWQREALLPDPALPDRKEQLKRALQSPAPAPAALIYFYCHCSADDGSQPVLRFGNTATLPDTLTRHDLSQEMLTSGPLVFANACSTSTADPHMTSELEDGFFDRGVRAFVGTEGKVPIRLASKFAWLYFLFFQRNVDEAPMAAGEALTQARLFLWTQYRNVGGLFYNIANQYDLFLASDAEVKQLRL